MVCDEVFMKVLVFSAVTLRPRWWVNFIDASIESGFYSIISINNALKPYGGRFSITFDEDGHANERWIEFEREEQYTWFLMRFS